jgi:hypothetical protein
MRTAALPLVLPGLMAHIARAIGHAAMQFLRDLRGAFVLPLSPDDQSRHDAAALRRLADGWRKADHGFAADLYAAADRHGRSGH